MKQSSHGLIGGAVPAVADRGWKSHVSMAGIYLFIYFVHSLNTWEVEIPIGCRIIKKTPIIRYAYSDQQAWI
jgi:hypothetical protein